MEAHAPSQATIVGGLSSTSHACVRTWHESLRSPYTVLESAKLNRLDPQAWLRDVIDRMAKSHPINRLGELLPWNWNNQIASLAA